jgi:hypothetical protein
MIYWLKMLTRMVIQKSELKKTSNEMVLVFKCLVFGRLLCNFFPKLVQSFESLDWFLTCEMLETGLSLEPILEATLIVNLTFKGYTYSEHPNTVGHRIPNRGRHSDLI